MDRTTKTTAWVVAGAGIALGVICGPAATWLQRRDIRPGEASVPDAVYVLAGERDQNRRVAATIAYAAHLASPGISLGAEPPRPILVLVGNDPTPGRWSSRDGRNLTLGEWAAREVSGSIPAESRSLFRCEVVPGRFRGTDGEMTALARYLRAGQGVKSIVVITSPFHMRRSVWRLAHHIGPGTAIFALPAAQTWRDRMPWTVLSELAKMVRDALGLGQAPLITRTGWPVGMHASDAVLIVLVLVAGYAWLLYPLLLRLAACRKKTDARESGGHLPRSAAVLVAAYNEEDVIRRRLENLVESCRGIAFSEAGSSPITDHRSPVTSGLRPPPAEPLAVSIHLGLDGCTDRTAEIAREYAGNNPAVHVHEFAGRRGKAAVLKDLVRLANQEAPVTAGIAGGPDAVPEVLVFTDANTVFRPQALQRMLARFADPGVGGVCGRLVLVSAEESAEGAYWDWEARLKEKESRLDSCLGANGAIYAVRNNLFWRDLPANTVIDDFVIGMKVREQGYKVMFEPGAVAEEDAPLRRNEWKRRVRIGAGDFQALALCRKCLSPRYGRFAWMFWSHKVLRWFTPHILLAIAAIVLWHSIEPRHAWDDDLPWLHVRHALDGVIGAAAVLGFAFAAVGRLTGGSRHRAPGLFRLADHFITMQAALFAGFLRYCRGDLPGYWTRTPRGEVVGGQ